MKVILLWTLLVLVCAGTSLAQFTGSTIDGSNLVYDHSSPTMTTDATVAFVDVWPYWNALTTSHDICKAIFNAISAFGTTAPQTIVLDARGITGKQLCTINPFATTVSLQAFTGKLLLGQVLIQTNVQWTLPNQYFWIEGTVMSNGTASVGSTIQASDGTGLNSSKFNCSPSGSLPISNSIVTGCPVVFISGPGCSGSPTCMAYVSEGTGIRDLAIDCNSLDGTVTGTSPCIGAGAYDTQEGGGIDTVTFLNQTTACIAFDSQPAINVMAVGISNSFIRNATCVFDKSHVSATKSVGVYVYATDGPAEISNTSVTVPGGGGAPALIADCIYLDGGRGVNINYTHCEHASTAEFIGGSGPAHAVAGANIRGLTASLTPLGVDLNNATDTSIQDLEMVKYTIGTPPFSGSLQDGTGPVIAAANLAEYVTSTTTVGTSMVTNVITTDASTPSAFNKATFNQETLTAVPGSVLAGITPTTNGVLMYCSNCMPGTRPCTATGSGALAVWNGTVWACLQ